MNPEAIVRAAVYLLRSCGRVPSATAVNVQIKAALGHGFRRTELCALIKSVLNEDGNRLGNRSGTDAELSGTGAEPDSSTTGTGPEQTGTGLEHHARGKTQDKRTENVTYVDKTKVLSPPVTQSVLLEAETATTAPIRGPSPPPKLDFDAPINARANAILAAFWARVQPVVGSAMTRRTWWAANRKTALEFARLGFPDAMLEIAHESACRKRGGELVYSLPFVHREIVALEAAYKHDPANFNPDEYRSPKPLRAAR
ncbi:MAG: hypothetical protein NVS2B17_29110 [Candidatus Velthaea sp.]